MASDINDNLSKAYIGDDQILSTLEIRHVSFVENEVPYALRIVNDNQDFQGLIESDAVLDAGSMVLFQACPFRVVMPEKGNLIPSLTVGIDDISLTLRPYLLKAKNYFSPIWVVYREYLTEYPEPQLKYVYRVLKSSGMNTVEFTAEMSNYYNRKVLNKKILVDDFPGLSIGE